MSKRSRPEEDYKVFMEAQGAVPGIHIDRNIDAYVLKCLNPSHVSVFSKLVLVQALVGLLTMTFCPQFDLSLTNRYELFHFFHRLYGEWVCMAICGGIFMGSGALASTFLFDVSDLRKVRSSPALYYILLSSIFLSFFLLMGAETYLKLSLAWVLGAISLGVLSHYLGSYLRQMTTN